jgi:cell division protein FtsB
LGSFNIFLAAILGYFTSIGVAAKASAFVGFVISIYWFLLIYGIAFLTIPLVRYFFLQWRNQKIKQRNDQRKMQADFLQQNLEKLKSKLDFARQSARRKIIKRSDIIYSTETDAIDLDIQQRAMLDTEWEKRSDGRSEVDN